MGVRIDGDRRPRIAHGVPVVIGAAHLVAMSQRRKESPCIPELSPCWKTLRKRLVFARWHHRRDPLEQFWDQYRPGGSLESERPTNDDYGEAVRRALIASGLSPAQASDLVGPAAAQRTAYGLSDSAAVPHIPPPIWRRRRN
jgi:hypothetical protein